MSRGGVHEIENRVGLHGVPLRIYLGARGHVEFWITDGEITHALWSEGDPRAIEPAIQVLCREYEAGLLEVRGLEQGVGYLLGKLMLANEGT